MMKLIPSSISSSGKEYAIKTPKRIIKPRGKNQNNYLGNMNKYEVNFGVGPAGTGKNIFSCSKSS